MKTKVQLRAFCEKTAEGRLRIVATDETIDRSGESIPFESWDLSNFQKSPRLLIDHDYRVQAIVGKAANVERDETRRGIVFDPVFHDITQAARETKEMVEQGFLDTVSVGFLRGEGEEGVQKNELMEISFVAVPANPNARMLSVKDIGEDETKAVEAFLKAEEEPKAPEEEKAPKEAAKAEGDVCTMEDGTEGTMQMNADGYLVCMLKPVQEPAPAEEGTKGAVADELNREETWKKKYELLRQVDGPMSALWRVYMDEQTSVEAFAGLMAEFIALVQPLAGQAAATDSIAGMLENEEGKGASMISVLSKIEEKTVEKAGRVLSEKNRGIISTAKDTMQSGVAALEELLKATESDQGVEEAAEEKETDASETKGRSSNVPQAVDSYQRFIELRRVARAINTVLSDALGEAKLRQR